MVLANLEKKITIYILHVENFRILSGPLVLFNTDNLALKPNNDYSRTTVIAKRRTKNLQSNPYYGSVISVSRSYVSDLLFTGGKGIDIRTMSTKIQPVPVKVYHNADKEKGSIIEDNKGRTGIYRWVHIESGKSYIGSSVKLNIRFKQYFNYNHISRPTRTLRIYRALLKYGYSEFRLEILEYCSPDVLLEREQFYFDTLSPEYNILKVAGSPLGYRHSEAAKKIIGLASKNRKVLESSRELKREALLGKSFDKERIEKMRLSNTFRKPVLITNEDTKETIEFPSLTEAGQYLGVSRVTINKYLLNNIPYNGYTISASVNNPSLVSGNIPKESPKLLQQSVLLTNKETGDQKEFSSLTDAAKYLEVSRGRLGSFLNNMGEAKPTRTNITGCESIKGYIISKITAVQSTVNRKTKKVEVTDIDTKKVTIYPSFALAGKALGISPSSLSLYFSKNRTKPFRNKYGLKLV
uniref:GIY-YIG endonuclease n=1 Tax=Fusarium vorosii TaxID=569361 RepID=UPI002028D71E|nr:GIY-YIG endonuclease [Fusarium vorosii]UPX02650.1 GIY-YIG endonuclease [Fusarium vorosii]